MYLLKFGKRPLALIGLALGLLGLHLPARALQAQQQATADAFEPNDTAAQVLAQSPQKSFIQAGQELAALNFHKDGVAAAGDVDWFYFFAKDGANYRASTTVQPGVDTELAVFLDTGSASAPSAANPLASNDDAAAGNRASAVSFRADRTTRYWLRVWNKDPSPRTAAATYSLKLEEVTPATPTATATPVPSRTPIPGLPDRLEYNGEFASASPIQLDVPLVGLNFMPFNALSLNDVDNDYFALQVKTGDSYTCETFDLSPGTDTNIIVYDLVRAGLGGNDDADKASGLVSSRFTWRSSYNGLAYVLVGDVQPAPANVASNRRYSLLCYLGGPRLPTALVPSETPAPKSTLAPTPDLGDPAPTVAPRTPAPALPAVPTIALPPTAVPFPTTNFPANLPFRPLGRAVAVSTQAITTGMQSGETHVISLVAFADGNGNGRLDAGEAMPNLSIVVLDALSLEPLDTVATDAGGNAALAVVNEGPVRVTIPLLGYNSTVTETSLDLRLVIGGAAGNVARFP